MLQLITLTIANFGVNLYSAAKKMVCSPCVQKYVVAFWMGFYCVSDAMASSKGAGGFSKATTEIQSYETPVSNLMKAARGRIQRVFQDAEWRPGREEDRHDDHRRMCGFHCHVGGPSHVLQVKGTPMLYWGKVSCLSDRHLLLLT